MNMTRAVLLPPICGPQLIPETENKAGALQALVAGFAGGDTGAVFAANDESAFDELRNYGDTFCPIKDLLRHRFIGSGGTDVVDGFCSPP